MFPAAMPFGGPPAPLGSRRITDTDIKTKSPAVMGFSARYVHPRDARLTPEP